LCPGWWWRWWWCLLVVVVVVDIFCVINRNRFIGFQLADSGLPLPLLPAARGPPSISESVPWGRTLQRVTNRIGKHCLLHQPVTCLIPTGYWTLAKSEKLIESVGVIARSISEKPVKFLRWDH
jgi:hypothetical protein